MVIISRDGADDEIDAFAGIAENRIAVDAIKVRGNRARRCHTHAICAIVGNHITAVVACAGSRFQYARVCANHIAVAVQNCDAVTPISQRGRSIRADANVISLNDVIVGI